MKIQKYIYVLPQVIVLLLAALHTGFSQFNELAQTEIADHCTDIGDAQSLYPQTSPEFAFLPYVCAPGNLEGATPDTIDWTSGCDFSGTPTIWFRVVVDEPAQQLFTRVTARGRWRPVWSVFYGPSCDSLSNAAFGNARPCSLDDGSPDLHQIRVLDGITVYYIAVTADPEGPAIDDPGFDICAATTIDGLICQGDIDDNCDPDPSTMIRITDRERAYLEPDYDPETGYMGPFCPGEELTVQIGMFYDATESGVAWLIGMIPDFGPGWDLNNFSFEQQPAKALGMSGIWNGEGSACAPTMQERVPNLCTYRDERGVLRLCNTLCESCTECDQPGLNPGDPLPGGYFWMMPGGNEGCVSGSCKPGENYGIGTITCQIDWEFSLRVRNFTTEEELFRNRDLQIGFHSFSDETAGCWEDPVVKCIVDRKQLGPRWEVSQEPCEPVGCDSVYIKVIQGDDPCFESCMGSLEISNLVYGTPPFIYNWSTGEESSFIEELCAGMYFVTVADAKGCTIVDSFRIVEPPLLEVFVTTSDETQAGATDGSATAMPTGGVPPYDFQWSNGQMTDGLVDLASGAYSVTVIDAHFCEAYETVEIKPGPCPDVTPAFSLADVSCYQACDGRVSIDTVLFANEPVSYAWNTGAASAVLESLCAGMYVVTLSDALGCMSIDSITLFSPAEIPVEVDTVIHITSQGSGSIAIAESATGEYLYHWTGPGGFASEDASIYDLTLEGCYTLTVTQILTGCVRDTTFCIDDLTGTLLVQNALQVKLYPNPASEYILMDFSEARWLPESVTILDVHGKPVTEIIKPGMKESLHTGDWPNGIYFLQFDGWEGTYYRRIVIGK